MERFGLAPNSEAREEAIHLQMLANHLVHIHFRHTLHYNIGPSVRKIRPQAYAAPPRVRITPVNHERGNKRGPSVSPEEPRHVVHVAEAYELMIL